MQKIPIYYFSCVIFYQHWHGFFQARTSDMDGPAFVNQCPIPPNTTFVYDFSTAAQSGKSASAFFEFTYHGADLF